MELSELVNVNYATDKDEQKSILEGIYTLGGSIIGQASKSKGKTALSLMEAEYYSITIRSQDLMFICIILIEIEELIEPGYILSINTGANLFAKNKQAEQ